MNPSTFFRANVGAILINSQHQVLALERSKIKGAWQFPQGGIDEGETLREAVQRELEEETGILAEEQLDFLSEYERWTVYELPTQFRKKFTGRGQVQRWFLFQVKDDDLQIELEKAADKEFSAWKWMEMGELVEIVIPFRRQVYTELHQWLKEQAN